MTLQFLLSNHKIRSKIILHGSLIALNVIYISITLVESWIDLPGTTLKILAPITVSCLFLSLLIIKFKYTSFSIATFSVLIYSSIQLHFLIYPETFNDLVYWYSMAPLFSLILEGMKMSRIWFILVLITITLDATFLILNDYALLENSSVFMGLFFSFAIMSAAYLLFGLLAESHQKAKVQNQRIRELLAELRYQNSNLMDKQHEIESMNEELLALNDELSSLNGSLENAVMNRTKTLEEQNKQLSEYAFINSHLLRAPVSRILGLVNLAKKDSINESKILEGLTDATKELDGIVRNITQVLAEKSTLKRTDIENLKKHNKLNSEE